MASSCTEPLRVIDLGRIAYRDALDTQRAHHAEVLAARERAGDEPGSAGEVGRLLLLEHDPPVITVSRRPGARTHLLASDEALSRAGVEVCETDRGGDITYHGPGQLVAYPILDLNRLGLGLHAYMRTLEEIVIGVCARFGVQAGRDPAATGVWVPGGRGGSSAPGAPPAKICAMGIRVRRWVSLHGLALNLTTDLTHFDLIVPCGLAGRSVTSLERELGEACPSMDEVKRAVAEVFIGAVESRVPSSA